MAKLSVQGYRDRSREIIGLDDGDLPDLLMDLFITQGMRYAQRWNQGLWPQYEYTWTMTLTPDKRDYTFAELAVNDSGYPIAVIRDIRSDLQKEFTYMARTDFDRKIPRDTDVSTNPYIWSPRDSESIRLFPIPSTAVEIDVHGWRKPINWVAEGGGGESDLPEDFDDAILCYTLGKVYAQQDEGQTSVFWLQMADVHLNGLEDMYDAPPPVDAAMNSVSGQTWAHPSGRLPFTFEY